MISKEDVKHIAKLARLDLTEQETEKMQKDLSEILEYFNILKKAPKVEVSENRTAGTGRKDEIKASSEKTVQNLLKASPDRKDDYIKVKAIF